MLTALEKRMIDSMDEVEALPMSAVAEVQKGREKVDKDNLMNRGPNAQGSVHIRISS